jgi:hypothetical protein
MTRQRVVRLLGPGRPLCRAVGPLWGDQVRLRTSAVRFFELAWLGALHLPRCLGTMSPLGAVPLDRRLPSPNHRKVALARNRRLAPSITPVLTG